MALLERSRIVLIVLIRRLLQVTCPLHERVSRNKYNQLLVSKADTATEEIECKTTSTSTTTTTSMQGESHFRHVSSVELHKQMP